MDLVDSVLFPSAVLGACGILGVLADEIAEPTGEVIAPLSFPSRSTSYSTELALVWSDVSRHVFLYATVTAMASREACLLVSELEDISSQPT